MFFTTIFVALFAAVAAVAVVTSTNEVTPKKTTLSKENSSSNSDSSTPPIVRTNNGAVRGRIVNAANGRYALEFLNLPYAQPPIDKLRFRPPQPVKNWSGERDSTKLGNACAQSTDQFSKLFPNLKFQLNVRDPLTLSEDCLVLNVHTPYQVRAGEDGSLWPVLLYIHGGGFQW